MSDISFGVVKRCPEQLFGWLEAELPKSVMSRLQSYIETAKKNSINVNHNLAGNISKSLKLEDKDNWLLKNILIPHINKFDECYPTYATQVSFLTEDAPYYLDRFWVNFQKENEFNPLHDHTGIFSFVVWVKIPTDWREQHALPISAASNTPCASDFEFWYMSMWGQLVNSTYRLNKESEGQMLLFPAKLMHTVHPFYNCDKERISISGNIKLDTSENAIKKYREEK